MSGLTNANRKYTTDPPKARVSLHLPEEIAAAIDTKRGEQSRNAWIADACVQKLKLKPGEDPERSPADRKAWLESEPVSLRKSG